MFQSTNLTADGRRRSFWQLSETVVPGHEVLEAIERASSTNFPFLKSEITTLCSINLAQMQEECYTDNCRQPRSTVD